MGGDRPITEDELEIVDRHEKKIGRHMKNWIDEEILDIWEVAYGGNIGATTRKAMKYLEGVLKLQEDGVINGDVKGYFRDRVQDACWLCQSRAYGDNVRELERACLDEDGKAITGAIAGMGVFIGMNPIKGVVRN